MIIAVSGITGVGKSYLKRCLSEALGINNILMVTTRQKRYYDVNGKDKWFITEEDFEKKRKNKEIILSIDFLDNQYGYYANELKSDKHGITEIYFSEVDNFKKECKDVMAVYIKPSDMKISKEILMKRKLDKQVIEDRIKEMENQIKNFEENEKLQQKYDYIFVNDYTDKSKERFINLIKEKIIERG